MVRGPLNLRFVYIWLGFLLCCLSGRYRKLYRYHKYSIDLFERSARIYLDIVAQITSDEEALELVKTKINCLVDSSCPDCSLISFSNSSYDRLIRKKLRLETSLVSNQWKLQQMKVDIRDTFEVLLPTFLEYYYSFYSSLSGKRMSGERKDLVRLSAINNSLAYFENIISLIQDLMVYQSSSSSNEDFEEEEEEEDLKPRFSIFF
jgi:hypothetical protein